MSDDFDDELDEVLQIGVVPVLDQVAAFSDDEEPVTTPVATWAPLDLSAFLDGTHEPIVPTLMTRTDGVSLLYPGLTHSLHGESESGKSLVVQAVAAERVMAGRAVLYVDFESDPASVTERMLMLGATPDLIRGCFHYLQPELRHTAPSEAAAWQGLLQQRFDLAVIDGVTDALSLYGLSTVDNDEITIWAKALPRKIAKHTGAAVVQVDHVTKDSESRGRFAIGGQAKMNGLTGAAYTVEVDKPLGRGLRGVVVLRVAKDRPGYVRGQSGPMRKGDRTQEAARVVVDSTGPETSVTVEPWQGIDGSDSNGGQFRPTHLMQKVSEALEAAPAPLTFRGIDDAVTGKREYVKAAVELLITEGFVSCHDGPRNARMHISIADYREVSDPASDEYVTGSGHSQPSNTTVSVPRLKDGGRGTHTQPVPGTVGAQSGHTADPDPEQASLVTSAVTLAAMNPTCGGGGCNSRLTGIEHEYGRCWSHLTYGEQQAVKRKRAS